MRVVHAQDLPERVNERQWLVEPAIPAFEVSLVTGSRRSGKGLFCAHLAACASQGQRPPWDMAARDPLPEHHVLWVTASTSEDSETEIRDRVRAAGGELNRLRIVALDRDDDIEALRPLLSGSGSKLVIIDPLQSAIGDLGSITARDRMEDLVGLARSTSSTVIAIRHITKSGKARGRGEIADVVRSEIYLGHHPDDPDLFVAAPAPSSYGEGEPVAFRITQLHGVPAIVRVAEDWDDNLHHTDLIPTPPRRRRARRVTARERAKNWLLDLLAAGPMPREDVLAQGRRRRLRERTIERAASDLGVQRQPRRENGRIMSALWSLGLEIEEPDDAPPPAPAPLQPRRTAEAPEPQDQAPPGPSPSATRNITPAESDDQVDTGVARFRLLDLSDDEPRTNYPERDDDDPGVARFRRLDLD